jgi:hypothetical protein
MFTDITQGVREEIFSTVFQNLGNQLQRVIRTSRRPDRYKRCKQEENNKWGVFFLFETKCN